MKKSQLRYLIRESLEEIGSSFRDPFEPTNPKPQKGTEYNFRDPFEPTTPNKDKMPSYTTEDIQEVLNKIEEVKNLINKGDYMEASLLGRRVAGKLHRIHIDTKYADR
jgi:hypothetical protein